MFLGDNVQHKIFTMGPVYRTMAMISNLWSFARLVDSRRSKLSKSGIRRLPIILMFPGCTPTTIDHSIFGVVVFLCKVVKGLSQQFLMQCSASIPLKNSIFGEPAVSAKEDS